MRALAIATLVVATSLHAAAAAKDKSPSFEVIILAGGSTPAEAEAARTASAPVFERVVRATDGFPKVVRSDDYEGLRPGFVILVAGICAKKADAAAVRDIFNASGLVGVYTRTVKGTLDGQCPTLNTSSSPSRGWDEDKRAPVVDSVASVVMRLLSRAVTKPKGCDAKSVKIVVEQAGKELTSRTFDGECVAPAGGDDVGSSSSFDASLYVENGRSAVTVRGQVWLYDTPDTSCNFYEWKDGVIVGTPCED